MRSGVFNTRGQRGFTLIELMIATVIGMLVLAAVGWSILHLFNMNTLNSDDMTAVQNVQTAGYWITRDGEMALPESVSSMMPGGQTLLELSWHDSDNLSVPHSCDYTLENYDPTDGTYTLWRNLDGVNSPIARHIIASVPTNTISTDSSGNVTGFVVDLTSKLVSRGITSMETRQYHVTLRPTDN